MLYPGSDLDSNVTLLPGGNIAKTTQKRVVAGNEQGTITGGNTTLLRNISRAKVELDQSHLICSNGKDSLQLDEHPDLTRSDTTDPVLISLT